MNRTILYYPTIDIPTENWLRNAILYWDEVSSIVPKSWDDNILINLSPDIHYLLDEGQFRPIKPEDLINNRDNFQEFHNFQQEFIDVVSSENFKIFLERNPSVDQINPHQNKIELNSRIHSNKTSQNIYYFLKEQGLAEQDGENEWIYFEYNTALLYMSLLAKYLADIDSNQTTIGTDDIAYEKFNFKRVSENEGFPAVSFNFNNVLPTPTDNVPFEKIVNFKRKREQNLRHFKKTMSDFQSRISGVASKAEMKEVTINFKDTLMNGVDDLVSVMNDHKIEFKIKSLQSLISLKSPTTIAATIAAAGEVITSNFDIPSVPLNFAVIGLPIIGAIELTTKYIDNRNKERAIIRDSPFSYIYYARKEGIII